MTIQDANNALDRGDLLEAERLAQAVLADPSAADCHAFAKKRIQDVRRAAQSTTGLVYHVTPFFLLPNLLKEGKLRCGRDAPYKRSSSAAQDRKKLDSLGGKSPADHVMLFRKERPDLLKDKLQTRGSTWKAFPHVRLGIAFKPLVESLSGGAFGSPDNVGRKLAKGEVPLVKRIASESQLDTDIEELLVPCDAVDLFLLREITAFSPADEKLVKALQEPDPRYRLVRTNIDMFRGKKSHLTKGYTDGQRVEPGAAYLERMRALVNAWQQGDAARVKEIQDESASDCFD